MTNEPGPSEITGTPRPDGLETIVRGFEAAWRRGQQPNLDAALAGLTGADRTAALVELAHAELELRLKAGEPARVEDYLRRYLELSSQPSVLESLIDTEYRQRRPIPRRGWTGRRWPLRPRLRSRRGRLLPPLWQAGHATARCACTPAAAWARSCWRTMRNCIGTWP
jgi:hypothetical protein